MQMLPNESARAGRSKSSRLVRSTVSSAATARWRRSAAATNRWLPSGTSSKTYEPSEPETSGVSGVPGTVTVAPASGCPAWSRTTPSTRKCGAGTSRRSSSTEFDGGALGNGDHGKRRDRLPPFGGKWLSTYAWRRRVASPSSRRPARVALTGPTAAPNPFTPEGSRSILVWADLVRALWDSWSASAVTGARWRPVNTVASNRKRSRPGRLYVYDLTRNLPSGFSPLPPLPATSAVICRLGSAGGGTR